VGGEEDEEVEAAAAPVVSMRASSARSSAR
jgi:hypothetical protein